jgi:RND family efflux transporter MFP subunit
MRILLACILCAALALNGCGSRESAHARQQPAPVIVGREDTALVARREIERGPVIAGRLTPERQATVRAEVGGTVLDMRAEQGRSVARGQLLGRIDESATRTQVASARSIAASARNAVSVAERDVERQDALVQAGAVAVRDLEAARQALANARAQLASAVAQVAAAEEQLERTRVVAPIAGVVSERPVNAGDVVQPGAALFTILDPSAMNLEATVPAAQIGQVHVEDRVTFEVTGYQGRTFGGRVDRINPAADPSTGQVRVYVTVPNRGKDLVAGLFAQGRIAAEQNVGLTVPAEAVATQAGTATVAVVRNGKVERVPVQVGIRDELTEQVELRSGVKEGDVVLLGAAQTLTPGTDVRITDSADAAGGPERIRPAATSGRR